MRIKTIGNAIAFACAIVTAGAAQAIEVATGGTSSGPAFTASDDKDLDGVRPWQVYSDPTCDSVAVPEMTFNTTAFGAKPGRHEHEKSYAAFGDVPKGHVGENSLQHIFGKSEKYEVSNFHGYGHHSNWKPDDVGDYCTPVPEPQTYALLMAGLGALTFVARRRKTALK